MNKKNVAGPEDRIRDLLNTIQTHIRPCCQAWPLVNPLGLSLPRKSVDRLTDHLDMTIVVDWDVKHSNKQII